MNDLMIACPTGKQRSDGDPAMRVLLLAMRWARARDARLVAQKAKRDAEGRGILYAMRSGTDQTLTATRREEARAKRLLLAACKTMMASQQVDVIDV
ncbi:hypothetical protein [Castellaniella sp. MT123]|uniref:hypothetical protein n=1 Tax=Castellaniella sp. MT123 TaxID=3140381 RepID=UPI0031F3F398